MKALMEFRLKLLMIMCTVLLLAESAKSTPGSLHGDPRIPKGDMNNGTQFSNTISWQVHSYNDLNEWHQVLRKRTVYFKVDPHYMPYEWCKSQKRFPTDQRGCFVLNHDNPLSITQYNSTSDLLGLIASPNYTSYFNDPTQKMTIALCFKYSSKSPCDGSDTAENWTSLVDDFFAAANAMISKLSLNLEFILDGVSTPSGRDCLIDKWRPWVATWIPGSDPELAAFSNNATAGYDRFQVFNAPDYLVEPSLWIDFYSKLGYGKYANSTYPYLFWEPSAQSPILEVANSYINGPIHDAGFRFAINIDPAMLQVYAGSYSGVAWNYNILPEIGVDNPKVGIIESTTNSSYFYILTVYTNSSDGTSHYTVSFASNWNSTALGPISATFNTDALPVAMNVTALSVISANAIFVSADDGKYAVYDFDENSLELNLLSTGYFEGTSDWYTYTANAFLAPSAGGDTDFYVITARSSPFLFGCQLSVQLYQFNNAHNPVVVGGSKCVQSGAYVENFNVAVLSVPEGQPIPGTVCGAGFLPGILMYSDSGKIVFSVYLCIDLLSKSILVNGKDTGWDGSPTINVDVGTSPSVSIAQLNGEVYVFEVHGSAYCWNTEITNKQPSPRLCQNKPFSIPYMLAYNYGSFNDWAFHIDQQLTVRDPIDALFGSCHSRILHGTYDSGSNPTTSLFTAVDPDTQKETLLFAEVHTGLPMNVQDTHNCGMSLPLPGLVLDSWPINDWIIV